MFSSVVNGVDVFEIGIVQLTDMLESGSALLCEKSVQYGFMQGDYLSVTLASTFGQMERFAFIDQCFTDINKAAMHANVISGLGIKQALEVELWHVVDDYSLWRDWERKVFTVCPEMPRCYVCGDVVGPWVRVCTAGGGWAYLCETCFDRFNSINTLIGRYRIDCL